MLGKPEILICFQLIDNLIIQANYGGNEAFPMLEIKRLAEMLLLENPIKLQLWCVRSQSNLSNQLRQPVAYCSLAYTAETDWPKLKPPLYLQPREIKDFPRLTVG